MKSKNVVEEPVVAYEPEIVSLDQLDFSRRYSYADYFRWKFQERVELIKGLIHKMSAPSPTHQSVSTYFTSTLFNFFRRKACKVFAAPFDVRLPDPKKQTDDQLVFTVVQPDLCVICDPDKIDARGCIGAPDLIIEILSPGNTAREMGIKFDLYQEKGVKEYWLVEPTDKAILVYVLQDGRYVGLKPFTEEDEMVSPLFPELRFAVKEAFE